MLKEIRQQLLQDIKETLQYRIVDRYRGEFEEGSEWNPGPSACFIRVLGFKKRTRAADGTGLKNTAVLRIYAGANLKHGLDALDMVEELVTMLDGGQLEIESSGEKYRLSVSQEGMDMIFYANGFEGYAFNITAI